MKSPTAGQPVATGPGCDDASAAPAPVLSLYIVATTPQGTRAALEAAAGYAHDIDARIVLLVPHVVPYVQPLDDPADPVACVVDRFRRLAEDFTIDITVHVCLCRSHSAALTDLLPQDAVVLIGGRSRRLWRSREQRVAAMLTRTGRHVLFVSS